MSRTAKIIMLDPWASHRKLQIKLTG